MTPNTHQELVERVARALARHDNPKHENWWPSYDSRARAAISEVHAALSEPSDEAVETALHAWFKTHPLGVPIDGKDKADMRSALIAAHSRSVLVKEGE